jgi:hypothetical protein
MLLQCTNESSGFTESGSVWTLLKIRVSGIVSKYTNANEAR